MIGTKTNTQANIGKLIRHNIGFMLPFILFMIAGAILQLISTKREILLFVNKHYHDYSDLFFVYFTHVGDGLFCVAVIILLLFVRYGYALLAAGAFLLSALVSVVLKRVVFADAYRPKKFYETEPELLRFIDGIKIHTANSFPSGHTITSFAIFAILALTLKDKRWGAVFFVLALFAGFSRVYLAQHFFEDVYWGALIGVVSSYIIWYIVTQRTAWQQQQWWNKSLLNRGAI